MNNSHKISAISIIIFIATPLLSANEHTRQTFVSAAKEGTKDIPVGDEGIMETEVNSAISETKPKQRFIPVELFTGGEWDGKHELKLEPVSTSTCASSNGRRCTKYDITGPFKTEKNETKIAWAGDEIPYYRRSFRTRRFGDVVSFFTINNSKDGLVRIYDKRKTWGTRTYNGLGSKFPLGYWREGEKRIYDSKRQTSIEIIELYGPDNCLTFRWVIEPGTRRNQDNNYTFCPGRGLTKMHHHNEATK